MNILSMIVKLSRKRPNNIDVSNQDIDEISKSKLWSISIDSLNLSNNYIKSIKPLLTANIKQLDLSYNPIEDIVFIFKNPYIETLILDYAIAGKIKRMVKCSSNIKKLMISGLDEHHLSKIFSPKFNPFNSLEHLALYDIKVFPDLSYIKSLITVSTDYSGDIPLSPSVNLQRYS